MAKALLPCGMSLQRKLHCSTETRRHVSHFGLSAGYNGSHLIVDMNRPACMSNVALGYS